MPQKTSKKNIEDILALTPMQEVMLFYYLGYPQSDLYFEQLSLNISGKIDIETFERAWNVVVDTNEMLRTVFRWEKVEKPVQIVLKKHPVQPGYYDFSGGSDRERRRAPGEIKTRDRKAKFDLREVPFRVTLCKIEEDQYEMIISNHHLLYDGWSNGIIIKEFFIAYNSLLRKKKPIKPVKNKFKSFVKWLQNQEVTQPEKYWQEYLTGFDTKTELIIKIKGRKRDLIKKADNYQTGLPGDTTIRLENFIKKNKITLASFLYSAWGILMQKYNNSKDVLFGSTTSGRSGKIKGIESIVGLFINTLPIRVKTHSKKKISDVLSGIHHDLQEREKYANISLSNIRKYSCIDKREALFDNILVIENYPLDIDLTRINSDLSLNSYSIFEMTNYDLTVILKLFNGVEIDFIFNHECFARTSILSLSTHFFCIIRNILDNPGQEVSQLEIITDEEKNQLLFDFNMTRREYPEKSSICKLFEDQVEKTPNYIAIVFEGKHVSYRELNEKSNQLARELREFGVQIGCITGILVKRSIELIIAIIGVLKLGSPCLPLDIKYPDKRISFILRDLGVRFLLKQEEREFSFDFQGTVINVDCENRSTYEKTNLIDLQPSSGLAFLIYTSGSTGTPKGVMLSDKGINNHIFTKIKELELKQEDLFCHNLSINFVASIWLYFTPLFLGAGLHIYPEDVISNPFELFRRVDIEGIGIVELVPSLLSSYLGLIERGKQKFDFNRIKKLVLTGEKVVASLVNKFYKIYKIDLVNAYGQSECSDDTLHYKIPYQNRTRGVPIGKPANNTQVYVLDMDHNLQPIGVQGELYIWGDGLAKGYVNRPELTDEKFLPNPFMTGKKMFKTGDIVRWNRDGNIEFSGRVDHQVKLRGFRIELVEIESQLLKHAHIKEAVITIRMDKNGDQSLAAYIVSDKKPRASELRKFLYRELPAYMIPAKFFRIDHIPLTPNGKIDRNSLAAFGKELYQGIEYEAPESTTEKIIADTWKRVLKTKKVGKHDNFFDIGGNSLLIVRINSRLKELLGKDIPIVTLFQYPTVHSLARYLSRDIKTKDRLHNDNNDNRSHAEERRKSGLKPNTSRRETGFEIAVIGMAGRFPGAKHIDQFWSNLENGVESISFFTGEEAEHTDVEREKTNQRCFVRAKGVLENNEHFDSSFFGYTPYEAEMMDPQIRICHECAWEALENAGYNPGLYKGLIGFYVGATTNPYSFISPFFSDVMSISEKWEALQLSDKDYLSTRISYNLDLKGPSLTIQTACSTSLVAIDIACQGLLSRKCDIALAGGVSISWQDTTDDYYQEGMIISPDGHCRAFDARARGTIRGNGAGIVVLKRLQDAAADRDNIRAVILGSAVNNDGKRKVGYTAPSIEGQVEAIQTAHYMARVEPGSITYIEAHGSGTYLGDPIEVEALKQAFNTDKKSFCRFGSAKTNVGHLDAAAGVTGFIKTVLALEHQLIPPSLHFETPNPKINFENSPFYVNTEPTVWKSHKYPLRAGVSSFGIGGTNAHVILEEFSEGTGGLAPLPDAHPSRKYQLILLSAKTQTALEQMTLNLADHLKKNPGLNIADVAYTLQVGRKPFQHRSMIAASEVPEAIEGLSSRDSRRLHSFSVKEENRPVVFMFSGLGSLYVNMGLELYHTEFVFRQEMDICFYILTVITGWDMKEILFPGDKKKAKEKIKQTQISQVLTFIVEYALARLLMKWGIKAYAMIGYSLGEYVAACLSGVFSLEDALKLIVSRGQLIERLPEGAMLSVPLPVKELKTLLNHKISIAIDNGSSCVVAGSRKAVDAFEQKMNRRKLLCTPIQTSRAIHSPMTDSILEEFEREIMRVTLHKFRIPYISNVTGTWITEEEVTNPKYLVKHLRGRVRFSDGIRELLKEPQAIFVEIGPGSDLCALVKRHTDNNSRQHILNLLRPPRKKVSDVYYLLKGIGKLWLYGVDIDWWEFHGSEKRHRMPLPTYPFESQFYPIKVDLITGGKGELFEKLQLTRKFKIEDWFYVPSWKPSTPTSLSEEDQYESQSIWLVLIDACGLGSKIIKRLEQFNQRVITVKPGNEFVKISGSEYSINFREGKDYQTLIKKIQIQESKKIPIKILHLWNVTSITVTGVREYVVEYFDRIQDLGFYSLLLMAQAIGIGDFNRDIELTVIINNMFNIYGKDILFPEKATVLGPVKIIPQEYAYINCRCIDIDLPNLESWQGERFLDQLLDELKQKSRDKILAYRGIHRLAPYFERVKFDQSKEKISPLRKEGVYLITGGLGGIGLVVAKYLAKSVKARLILTGRTTFPARNKWEKWLASHSDMDEISRKIQKLQEIETLGAEVLIFSADVSHQKRMEEVIAVAKKRFGRINGVIHAALHVDGTIIHRITREMVENVFASKAKGVLVLDNIFKEEQLDFFILFSSLSSIVTEVGHVAYTSASIFLDAFAHYKAATSGSFVLSINWDTWAEVGGVVKMAEEFGQALRAADPKSKLKNGMLTVKGIEAFRRIITGPFPQVAVSTQDLVKRVNSVKISNFKEAFADISFPGAMYQRPQLDVPYTAPRNALEQKLVSIWRQLFGIQQVGVFDDFFDLGGDSLKAITVASKLNKEFNVNISLSDFFKNPTIDGLALYLHHSSSNRGYFFIQPAEKKEYYALSSVQKRLYILQQIYKDSTSYNVLKIINLESKPEKEKLESVFLGLIKRHEGLRTSFEMIGGEPVQRIHHKVEFKLDYYESEDKEVNKIIKAFVKPFDLGKISSLRVGLIKLKNAKHLLVMDMHHIITDGISIEIIVQDFLTLASGQELSHLKLQYKDFSERQNSQAHKEKIKKQEEFWLKEFEGNLQDFDLPTDYPRSAVPNFDGKQFAFTMDKETTAGLRRIAREMDATLFMLLLAVFNILLAKLSGNEEIIIGTVVSGRNSSAWDNVIGMFVNTLALRNYPAGKKTFKTFLKEVKEKTFAAFDNQEYQFEDLVGQLGVNRDITRNPLYDIELVFQNIEAAPEKITKAEISDFKRKEYKIENAAAKFDVTLTVAEVGEELSLTFEYKAKLYKEETIKRFATYFKKIVSSILNNQEEMISKIEIMSEEEKGKAIKTIRSQAGKSFINSLKKHQLDDLEAEFDF